MFVQFQVSHDPEGRQCFSSVEDSEKTEKPVVFEAWMEENEHSKPQTAVDNEALSKDHQDECHNETNTSLSNCLSTSNQVEG